MQKPFENIAFLLVLALITALFLTLLMPFSGAVLWACILSVLFHPLQRRLATRWQRNNLATFVTLLICISIGVVPTLLLLVAFFRQGATFYHQMQTGELNPTLWFARIQESFPGLRGALSELGIDLTRLSHQLADSALDGSRFLAQNAVQVGQSTLQFLISLGLMLYLLFFLLRDGSALVQLLVRALPLGDEREQLLMTKFVEVVRATVKGNLVVAIVQGCLGGLIFWLLSIPNPLLWGGMMIVLSMVPVVGASLVWGPVAIYLFAVGDWVQGSVLTVFCVGVIGLVDNFLRPLLVGRDLKMPDYLVLLSTLGGISLFGLNGFVLGPLVAALFMAFWGIFMRDFTTDSES